MQLAILHKQLLDLDLGLHLHAGSIRTRLLLLQLFFQENSRSHSHIPILVSLLSSPLSALTSRFRPVNDSQNSSEIWRDNPCENNQGPRGRAIL